MITTSIFKQSILMAAVGCCLAQVQAEVRAVQIQLNGDSPDYRYRVPAGKVLIIEHVIFTNYWDINNEDKRIFLDHAGGNPSGNVWATTQNYGSNWNQLLRPLRLPAGVAVSMPFFDSILYKVFLYGLLADEGDLYAGVEARIDDTAVADIGPTRILSGNVTLESPRPSRLRVEKSTNLEDWQPAPESDIQAQSAGIFTFSIESPATTPKQFVRLSATARPKELLPPFSFRLIPVPF